MLVPALAAGAAGDLGELRGACTAAVDSLLAARPRIVLMLGAGDRKRRFRSADHGSFAAYGVDLRVGFGDEGNDGTPFDELSMLVGCWLLDRALTDRPLAQRPRRVGVGVPADLPTDDCVALGTQLAEEGRLHDPDTRVALLVMGDAAARRATAAPGAPDEEADTFDRRAEAALRSGDPAALRDLDAGLAARVGAVGRAPWQVLAGALGRGRWHAQLRYVGTPLEVTYLAGTWRPA